MLLLKRHLVELVRCGKKRQTIRLWSRPLLRAGQISYTPGLGKMRILAVDLLPGIDALSEQDAQLDGFDTLAALRAEIIKIYGTIAPSGKHVYRIQFEWPIDDAGRQLVATARTHTRASEAPKKRVAKNFAARQMRKPNRKSTGMTVKERRQLRDFILHRDPH